MTYSWWLFGKEPKEGFPRVSVTLKFKMPWWKRKIAELVFDSEWE